MSERLEELTPCERCGGTGKVQTCASFAIMMVDGRDKRIPMPPFGEADCPDCDGVGGVE